MNADNQFIQDYNIQQISEFAFRNAAHSWIAVQMDMISWRKEVGAKRNQKWAFSSIHKYEFAMLMLGSFFQSKPMDVKEITDRLKVSEKTVYSFIHTSEAEGWIDVSRSKKGNHYKASQEVVDSYYRFLTRYFKAVTAHDLKKNFDMVSHLDDFRKQQSA